MLLGFGSLEDNFLKQLKIALALGIITCAAAFPKMANADEVCTNLSNVDLTRFCVADSRDGSHTILYSIGAIRMITANSGQKCEYMGGASNASWGYPQNIQ